MAISVSPYRRQRWLPAGGRATGRRDRAGGVRPSVAAGQGVPLAHHAQRRRRRRGAGRCAQLKVGRWGLACMCHACAVHVPCMCRACAVHGPCMGLAWAMHVHVQVQPEAWPVHARVPVPVPVHVHVHVPAGAAAQCGVRAAARRGHARTRGPTWLHRVAASIAYGCRAVSEHEVEMWRRWSAESHPPPAAAL